MGFPKRDPPEDLQGRQAFRPGDWLTVDLVITDTLGGWFRFLTPCCQHKKIVSAGLVNFLQQGDAEPRRRLPILCQRCGLWFHAVVWETRFVPALVTLEVLPPGDRLTELDEVYYVKNQSS